MSAEFIMLFKGPDWDKGLSPEELQAMMARVMKWFQTLHDQGRVKGGQPLARLGRTISRSRGQSAEDGPFVESKEAVGGYLVLLAEDLEEAVEIAKENPTLEHGIEIEVRPVLAECPIFERARKRFPFAMAS